MCGRYTLRAKPSAISEEFDLHEVPNLRPRFNIAPNQPVAVVRFDPHKGVRRLDSLTWGLVPSWADDPGIGDRLINARAETVAEKPAFRHPFRTRRCLVVADGFYEWQRQDGWKRPFFVHMKDDRPFAFAGLWEHWEKGEEPIYSCILLTIEANEVLAPIHDRMPVIIPRSAYNLWLDPGVHDPKQLEPLLVPFPGDQMEAYPVSRLVNDPGNDVPECFESIETEDWFPGLSSQSIDSRVQSRNLFSPHLSDLPEELVETLAKNKHVRIERIVSNGHASPEGFCYDQEETEWVVVLKGEAKLVIEGYDQPIDMKPGDHVTIPPHQRHRVEWTTPNEPTVWLAVFYGD